SAEMSAEQGAIELNRIGAIRPRYGPLTTIGASAVASAGAAVFLGGGVADIGAAGMVGLAMGILIRFAQPRRELWRAVEIVGGMVAAVLALVAERYIPGAQSAVITVSGVIMLLPG